MSEKNKKPAEANLQSVKGMHDIIGADYYLYQGFSEKAAEIAIYYGFQPIDTPTLEKEDLFLRGVGEENDMTQKEMYTLKTRGGDRLAMRPEGTAGVMRSYLEHGMHSLPQPLMFYYYGPFYRHENPQAGRKRQFHQFGLEVLGTKKSVADAMIIMMMKTTLEEAGLKNLQIDINSIGDNDCRGNWRRELTNYYKKHIKEICPDCRERLKTNPLRVLDCKNEKCQEIKAGAPESISYLCSGCKAHFKEVLEYLDSMKIEYRINPSLVRGLDYYTRTVFEISSLPVEGQTGLPLALGGGGRYDYLAKTLGSKKDVPAVGASIGVDRVVMSPDYEKLTPRIIKKPKVFFIQLSPDAKMKSFEVIEILRGAKIPLVQTIAKDSLGAQLAQAEKLRVPYAVILGQKEAMEGTVIVRHMDTRSQDTVKIGLLAEYFKSLK
ncbi:MAG: histidine--tRNA ligase [Candidatus Pacebacteria bacterium]|nr:histidine--tRNA ligase [Candidatus Paceibacterota bacterium]